MANPDGKGGGTLLNPPPSGDAQRFRPDDNGIQYHGGPIMLGTPNIYYIWYGNWNGNSAVEILTDWANTIGGSPYYNINTTYFDDSGTHLTNAASFAGRAFDAYSRGSSISDADVLDIVADQITLGALPADSNGVYFVLSSADVSETSGFCSSYCGWHTFDARTNIKVSFVGNADRCPFVCEPQWLISPNGNPGADAMASVLAHEFEETTSDPYLNAWFDDSNGDENADKCAWTFGTEYITPNGARANMRLGDRDFLIQQNWVNARGGYCALNTLPDRNGYEVAFQANTGSLWTVGNGGNGDWGLGMMSGTSPSVAGL